MTSEEYANRIARDWNTKDAANGNVGYVTRFAIDATFIASYEPHEAGGRRFQVNWIPAEDLDAFHDATVGNIEVIGEYHASGHEPVEQEVGGRGCPAGGALGWEEFVEAVEEARSDGQAGVRPFRVAGLLLRAPVVGAAGRTPRLRHRRGA